MKFRMKTMATLFAAILIAMMGVMPALAYDNSLGLSVTVQSVIALSIEIDVDSLAFGSMYVGDSVTETFSVTASGTAAATVTSTLASEDYDSEYFWMKYLDLTCPDPTVYTIATTELAKGYEATEVFVFTADLDLTGAPPATYTDALIFWIST